MKRTAHLVALLVLFSTASAQYVEPWGATRALRMKEAAKLHDELSAMDKQVPYSSPAEQKWLDGELNSGNGKITEV
jgi:cytochrome c556